MMISLNFSRGHFWIRAGHQRLFWIKDVRYAKHVLFSDRYASYHLGPFAIQVLGFPHRWADKPIEYMSTRVDRLISWRKKESS